MALNFVVKTTLISLCLIVSVNCLGLDVRPQIVRPNDQNVRFTCAGGNETNETFIRVLRMSLQKLNDDEQWTEIAILRFDGTISMTDHNATSDGQLGNFVDSNLIVTWPVAPEHIYGQYRCDAIAITTMGDVTTIKSTEVQVKSLSNDMSVLLERLKKSEKRLVGKVNETMYSAMKSSKSKLFSVLDIKFKDLKQFVANKTAETASTSKLEKERETMDWPEGQFTLLMPSDGCPLRPAAWIKGFKKMKALPDDDKYFPIDSSLHLANPHKTNGFIYRQFCTLPDTEDRTELWPAGRYCLYSMKERFCPSNFIYTKAQVKIGDKGDNFYLYYLPKGNYKSGNFAVSSSRFCCRNDGDAEIPIDLPVLHPFYLFRNGGRCQEVKGMDVTQDVFMMETVEDPDYDKWFDGDIHPDLTFAPYKENLCYYTRKEV